MPTEITPTIATSGAQAVNPQQVSHRQATTGNVPQLSQSSSETRREQTTKSLDRTDDKKESVRLRPNLRAEKPFAKPEIYDERGNEGSETSDSSGQARISVEA